MSTCTKPRQFQYSSHSLWHACPPECTMATGAAWSIKHALSEIQCVRREERRGKKGEGGKEGGRKRGRGEGKREGGGKEGGGRERGRGERKREGGGKEGGGKKEGGGGKREGGGKEEGGKEGEGGKTVARSPPQKRSSC